MRDFSKPNRRISAISLALVVTAVGSGQALAEGDDGAVLVLDSENKPVYAADADGRELSFVYDASGDLIATIDESGTVVDWAEILEAASQREQ